MCVAKILESYYFLSN